MGDDLKITVPKLNADGSNWVTYRDRMLWAVGSRNLLPHLTEATITAAYVTAGDVGILTPQLRWDLDQRIVKQLIGSSVPDTVFNDIKGGTTAKDVWDELKKIYETRTTLILVDLTRRLQTTRCAEDDNVREHFEKLKDLRQQLAALGRSVSDTEYAQILMGSLPKSYAPTLGGISAAAELSAIVPTVSAVTKLAVDEFDRRNLDEDKPQDTAFAADGARKKGKKRDIECFNCHKKGHVKAECWAKGGGKEGQGPKRRGGGSKDTAAGAEQSGDTAQAGDAEAWAVIVDAEEGEDETPKVPAMAADEKGSAEAELYDSGALRHMLPFCERFITYRDIPARPITAANNRVFYAVGAGDLEIEVPNGAKYSKVVLHDALHAPDMGLTVVSIGRIVKAGCTVQFQEGSCKIKRGDKVIGDIPVHANGLYKVEHALAATTEEVDIITLHRRLGHISADAIRTLIRSNAVSGLRLVDDFPPFACDSCEYAKMTRKAIRKEREAPPADAFGDEVHTDLWGPSPTFSKGGRKYYVTFTDDYSHYTWLEVLRTKDKMLEAYKA